MSMLCSECQPERVNDINVHMDISHLKERLGKKPQKTLFISQIEKLRGLDRNIQESQGVKEKNVYDSFVYHMYNVT